MKKIILSIVWLCHLTNLIGQVTVPLRVDTLFSSFQPTYLSDIDVRKLPCNLGIAHSMASSNVFGQNLNGNILGMSLNYPKQNDMYRPNGVFRIFNQGTNTSKHFYTRVLRFGIEEDTISLHNSTKSYGDYLLSGTLIKYSNQMQLPSIGFSYGIIGDININSNIAKYHQVMPSALMNAAGIGQSWNNQGSIGNDIIDATRTSNGDIYAVGIVSNSLLLPDGYMYLCKIENSTNQLFMYPLYDPALITTTNPYLPEMMPQKIFLDEAENVIYVIGRQITLLPPGMGSTRTIVPFIVKYDLNNGSATFKNYSTLMPMSNSGRFFDMKKATSGNYILGYSSHGYHEHGYLEIDVNLNIVSQDMYNGSSIHSASNTYTKANNTLLSNFGHNIYTDIHLPDNDNIQFYGWNTNGMTFANLYRGTSSINSSSPFYGIIFGNDYLTAENPTVLSLINYQSLATSQWKFQVFEGLYPLHRKSLTMLNGNYNFFASLPDSNKTCANEFRKDRILTRTSPINFAYSRSGLQSDLIQYVPINFASPSAGSYQGHAEINDTCINVLPIDYYSDAYPIHLMEYESFNNYFGSFGINFGININTELNDFYTFEENIHWINDNITDCSISNNVQYHQKSAQNDKVLGGKIINVEIYNLLGQSMDFSSHEIIGKKYNDQIEKEIVNGIQNKGIYFVNIHTEKGIYRNKISIN